MRFGVILAGFGCFYLFVFIVSLSHSSDMLIQEVVFTCRELPVPSKYFCSTFNVAVDLLEASLISFLLILSSVLGVLFLVMSLWSTYFFIMLMGLHGGTSFNYRSYATVVSSMRTMASGFG